MSPDSACSQHKHGAILSTLLESHTVARVQHQACLSLLHASASASPQPVEGPPAQDEIGPTHYMAQIMYVCPTYSTSIPGDRPTVTSAELPFAYSTSQVQIQPQPHLSPLLVVAPHSHHMWRQVHPCDVRSREQLAECPAAEPCGTPKVQHSSNVCGCCHSGHLLHE
jgi:hypothetical protein